jgi:hypothetical protein
VDAQASRQSDKKNLAGIGFAAAGALLLVATFRDVLRGHDLAVAFAVVAIGMGCLGGALAYLGEAPSAPTPRRIYRAVRVLIPLSLLAIGLWLLLR